MSERLLQSESEPLAPGNPGYNTFGRRQQTSVATAAAAGAPEATAEYAVHTMTGKETLQGLAIMYGVPISSILAANRMWARDDIHTRKFLYIPRATHHPSPSSSHRRPPSAPAKAGEREGRDIAAEAVEFRRATGTTERVARYYVETYADGTSLVAAIQRFREDLAASQALGGTGRATSPTRQPLMANGSSGSSSRSSSRSPPSEDDSAAAAMAMAMAHYQSPNKPRRQARIPQLDGFIDTFYDSGL
jgi:LysM repeat protein